MSTPTPKMFYLYILRSLKDSKLYIGSTSDLKRRFSEHNSGKNYSTRNRKPFELIYYEAYRSESDARQREKNLKLRSNAYSQLRKRIKNCLKIGVGVKWASPRKKIENGTRKMAVNPPTGANSKSRHSNRLPTSRLQNSRRVFWFDNQ